MFKCIKTKKSVLNNDINLFFNGHKNGKNLLIIGTTHGDEPQGAQVLNSYLLENSPQKNPLYIIPCLNPDGYDKKTRTNANQVDINRNFPTKNWELTQKDEFYGGSSPASEIETKFLINCIDEIQPDLILTIHAPFKIVNFDGNAQKESEEIASLIGYPVQKDIGYPTPGSFGTYCGVEKNIPTITLELGEDEDFNFQKEACFKIIKYLCYLD